MAIIDCPSCGRRISDLAVECPHCGWEVDREPPPGPPSGQPGPEGERLARRQPLEPEPATPPGDDGPRAGGWTSQPAPMDRRGGPTAAVGRGGDGPKIPNYLVPSILATICCCLPFGIVAIVYAAQVNGRIEAGDLERAKDASDKARIWTIAAVAFGVLFGIFWMVWSVASGDLQPT
jgi:hypothetical protein